MDDNLIATIDPLGNKTQYVYDARGRLIKQIDALGNSTTYSYDRADNLVEVVDKNGNKTKYTYDELNREIARINPNGDKFKTNYDKVSNVISTTDELGRVTSFDYDGRNRLTTTTNAENGVAIFQYDDAGNLLAFSDELNRTTNYTYDALNRQVSVKDPLNHVTTSRYDSVGNLIAVSDDNHHTTEYGYDSLNRLKQVTNAEGNTVTTEYDSVGNVTAVTDELDRTTNFTYDERNLQTSISDPLGHTSTTEYDGVGNAIALLDPLGNKTNYAYDPLYRLTSQTDAQNRTTNYSYDPLGNLLSLTDPEENTTNYTYDENGNRTNPGYVTGENNQLLSDGKYNYEYDGEGNRTKKTSIVTGEVTEYEWDYRNRLTGVVTKDGSGNVIKQADYTYDVFDRRIAKSVDVDGNGVAEKVERFVYDGDNIALTFDGEGNQKERFFHGVGIDEILAQENQDGEVLWAISDNQGSVRDVVDGDGTVVNHITYDSFGKVTSETDSNVDFRFGYVGKELDPETGLRRNGKRYVEGDRFISEDPIGFAGGDSNLYRYVNNSPVNYVDPLGLFLLTPDNSNPTYVPMPVGGGGLRNTIPTPPPSGLPNSLPPVVNPSRENPFDPLQINPDQKSNPFFPNFSDLFEKPNDWFKRMREFIEDIREENDEKEKEQDRDNNSDSCGWGDRDKYLPPQNSSQNGDNNDESIIESTSTLAEASDAANQAADNVDNWTPKNKHLQSTTAKRAAKFNTDDVNDVRDIVQEALRSPDAQFFPNNTDGSVRVVTDLKRPIGTKGQTKVRVIIGNDGEIWNAFPVNTN
ncbi:RHS repeat-associated core domain-containing protein [Stanieria cyanosphaera]|uniref:RHS repeat-associated core domain-containing protein n=1 Tax=Stanieria cyanosphaera TaxID=102116 RepID=UPI0003062C47